MVHVLGVDIGSVFSKAVVCADQTVKAFAFIPSKGNYKEAAEKVVRDALKKTNLPFEDISYTVATGYGASSVSSSKQAVTDISCQGKGIHHLFPSVRTIIEIGGQFSKVIKLDDAGRVTNFILNEKCAGGSGRFLQIIARLLHIDIEEIGPFLFKSQNPVDFNTGCAVFAESEAISRIAEGALKEDILAGIHQAMASKIINLIERAGLVKDCTLTGGGAKDIGLVKTFEASLGINLYIPEEPQISAAFGAALIAEERLRSCHFRGGKEL
jgi:predicted CoA-substrate-specific enzyme activase